VSSGRARTAVLLASIGLAAAGAPAPAAAAGSGSGSGDRKICVDKVAVWDSPGGFVIAYLYRPQTLRVLGTAQRRKWSLVRFDDGPRGWIPTNKICK
jgi:hypothetical protein